MAVALKKADSWKTVSEGNFSNSPSQWLDWKSRTPFGLSFSIGWFGCLSFWSVFFFDFSVKHVDFEFYDCFFFSNFHCEPSLLILLSRWGIYWSKTLLNTAVSTQLAFLLIIAVPCAQYFIWITFNPWTSFSSDCKCKHYRYILVVVNIICENLFFRWISKRKKKELGSISLALHRALQISLPKRGGESCRRGGGRGGMEGSQYGKKVNPLVVLWWWSTNLQTTGSYF